MPYVSFWLGDNTTAWTGDSSLDALAEAVLREFVVATLGLQSLDRYVSNALRHLIDLGERLSEPDLTRMMNYDPDRLVSWLHKPQPGIDSQMTLGYKALGLKEMFSYGYHVPEGFVLTTELYNVAPAMDHRPLYEHTVARICHALAQLEEMTGLSPGRPGTTAHFSIRPAPPYPCRASCSRSSMWAQRRTHGRDSCQTRGRRFGRLDSYRRFVQSWAMSAGVDRDVFDEIMAHFKSQHRISRKLQFSQEQMREIALAYKARAQELGVVFIDDPFLQVIAAVGRVLDSWHSPPARFYRHYMGVSDHWGHRCHHPTHGVRQP